MGSYRFIFDTIGALGNGFDRIINNYVIDFFDFHFNDLHWPAFNFADSFITVGGIIFFGGFFLKILRKSDKNRFSNLKK